jgi:hypothetical protein
MADILEFPKPYELRHHFAYSLRCVLCRMEVDHSQEEHDILRCGVYVEPVFEAGASYDD